MAVVGLGYVGLPTTIALRRAGMPVIGVDVSPARIDAIRALDVDLPNESLDALGALVDRPGLRLTTETALIAEADAVIVCVPTPVDDHLVPDLGPLRSALTSVVESARAGQVIVMTSTTYVGSTRHDLVHPLQRRGFRPGRDIHVAFAPERIDPGVPEHQVEATPRVVGGLTAECARRAVEVLAPTCPSVHVVASPEIAEMTKLLENTFRAVNIALANEMADIAEAFDLPIDEVIDAAATKPYGFMPFRPGAGVGGHCIPCDPHYLLWQLRGERTSAPLIGTAMEQIALRPRRVTRRSRELLAERGRPLNGSHVHVVGAAYKPGIADVRESPALAVIDELRAEGAEVTYEDPKVPVVDICDGARASTRFDELDRRPDLVVVLTRQPDQHLDWLPEAPAVLDATYGVPGAVPL